MAVIVMLSFGRSGSTMLNQCLGSLPDTVCLSEVNPIAYSHASIKRQARHWYGINIQADGFAESILELEAICEDRGQHLIVRDWTYINFILFRQNRYLVPSRFLTLDELNGKCDVIPFAFVRDAIDVWISFTRIGSENTQPPSAFFRPYLLYVKALLSRGIRVFRYEDFCQDPDTIMRQICEHTGLEYSESYQKYDQFTNVHGDVNMGTASRGIRQRRIAPLPRVELAPEIAVQLDRCAPMAMANRLLGYPTTYGGGLQ